MLVCLGYIYLVVCLHHIGFNLQGYVSLVFCLDHIGMTSLYIYVHVNAMHFICYNIFSNCFHVFVNQDSATSSIPLFERFYDDKHRAHLFMDVNPKPPLGPLRSQNHTPHLWDERYALYLQCASFLKLS